MGSVSLAANNLLCHLCLLSRILVQGRPITPAIGIIQQPSEEFVEEQLKVDNHLIAKQQKEQQSLKDLETDCIKEAEWSAGPAFTQGQKWIQILKQQIVRLQEKFKRNESCWHAAYSKLRDQVEMLIRQNMELRDELRVSEHQRWKAEKNPEAVNFIDRKSEPPVAEAILRETASSSKQEERSRRDNHKSDSISHVRPKTSLQKHFFRDVNSKPPKSILSRRPVLHQERRKSEEEVQEKIEYRDGKVEEVLTDGRRIITFHNGTKKEISADKRMTTISFFNGDVKKIMPDQRVIYYYADAQTTHTAYPDGLEVLQFPNNQIEKHYPDGTQEIVFPDHTVKCLYSDGFKETFFPDGTVVKVEKNGDKIVVFSNGQKEVHTAQFKRREYPDGTVKTVYCNGRQETKYSTGRVRIKDEEGNIILDKK
ncbi:PREDICTED: centromere protein J-like [Nipponia nippon]|nr:PREDICTED: centromere protein J-like [Nipponia nippon]